MKKKKLFIKLDDVATEIKVFLNTYPRISRNGKGKKETDSPHIKHIIRLSPVKQNLNLANNF